MLVPSAAHSRQLQPKKAIGPQQFAAASQRFNRIMHVLEHMAHGDDIKSQTQGFGRLDATALNAESTLP
jgi:hypothetical protein